MIPAVRGIKKCSEEWVYINMNFGWWVYLVPVDNNARSPPAAPTDNT